MLWLLLLFGFLGVASSSECYFDAGNSTHIKTLPRVITCKCLEKEESFHIQTDVVQVFEQELLESLESVNVFGCNHLLLNLSVEPDFNLTSRQSQIDVKVSDTKTLQIILDNADTFVRHIRLDEVTKVETILGYASRDIQVISSELSTEELYFYIIIGLGGLLLISWVIFLICFFVNRSKCAPRKRPKRVSRAESWKYESNIYVNPRQRQGQGQGQGQGAEVSSALQQMLPYQLVPQREALVVSRQSNKPPQSDQYNQYRSTEEKSYTDNSPQFGNTRSYPDNSNQFTDTSLQYADEDSDDDRRPSEVASNANSASYGSRNKAPTLPVAYR